MVDNYTQLKQTPAVQCWMSSIEPNLHLMFVSSFDVLHQTASQIEFSSSTTPAAVPVQNARTSKVQSEYETEGLHSEQSS